MLDGDNEMIFLEILELVRKSSMDLAVIGSKFLKVIVIENSVI
jgi:hypothetical protein